MKKTSLFLFSYPVSWLAAPPQPQIPLALTTPTQSPLMQEEQQENKAFIPILGRCPLSIWRRK